MKPGTAHSFVDEMRENGGWDKFRHDDGCLSYEYYFSASDPDKVILMEEWESAEKEAAHMQQPHMQLLWDTKAKYVDATVKHRCDFF